MSGTAGYILIGLFIFIIGAIIGGFIWGWVINEYHRSYIKNIEERTEYWRKKYNELQNQKIIMTSPIKAKEQS